MVKYTNYEIDQLIDRAIARHQKDWDHKFLKHSVEIDKRIDESIERAVGFYYEKTKHDFDLVMEAADFIKGRLDDMVTKDEFNELKDEVKTMRIALTDTNKDLNKHDKRISKLESAVF